MYVYIHTHTHIYLVQILLSKYHFLPKFLGVKVDSRLGWKQGKMSLDHLVPESKGMLKNQKDRGMFTGYRSNLKKLP